MRTKIKIIGEVVADCLVRYTKETYNRLQELRGKDLIKKVSLENGNIRILCDIYDVRGVWNVENGDCMAGEHTVADVIKCLNDDFDINAEDILTIDVEDWSCVDSAEHLELDKDTIEQIRIYDRRTNLGGEVKSLFALFDRDELKEFRKDCTDLISALWKFEKKYQELVSQKNLFGNLDDIFDEYKENASGLFDVLTNFENSASVLERD